MDYMDGDITEVQAGLQTVSIGVEAMKRLNKANMTVAELQVLLFRKEMKFTVPILH